MINTKREITMPEEVPFREGIFVEGPDGGALLGCQCRLCGTRFFPKGVLCLNCQGDNLEEIRLSRRGKLYSYATAQMPSAHFKPPYSVGYIDLPEDIRVFAPLRDDNERPFEIGMEMELVIEGLWEEDGKTIMGFRFKPV